MKDRISPSSVKPTDYYVLYWDLAEEQRLAAKYDCLPEDIDPLDVTYTEDAKTLAGAKSIARKHRRNPDVGFIGIYQRVDITDIGFWDNGRYFESWDWDYELVDDDI